MNDNNYKNLYAYYIEKLPYFLNISNLITENTPFTYFAYQRLYLGGKHLILFTNQEYAQHFFNTTHDLGQSFGERIKKSEVNRMVFHFWPSIPNTTYFEGMFSYKIWNGITVSIRKNDYVDVYYFGTSKDIADTSEIHNFYINKIYFINEYIDFFNNQAYEIINTKDPKILGQHTGSVILDKFEDIKEDRMRLIIPEVKRFFFKINNKFIYLTNQELKCVQHLSKGYSSKFIARKLNISPKTIQHYIQNIKFKTGLNSHDLLVEWFHLAGHAAP